MGPCNWRTSAAIIVPLLVIATQVAASREPLAVTLLYRHGDRTPINFYPNDPYQGRSNWPVGPGQLTAIGKRMHYELGKFLRTRYGELLGEEYNETVIHVRSTDVDRCLMSGMSNLAGLYPPKGDQVWTPDLLWQPIPVHTVPTIEDSLLSTDALCDTYDNLFQDTLDSNPDIQAINKKYKWAFDYASNHTGKQMTDLTHMGWLYDTLLIESIYNKTLPEWTSKIFPSPLYQLQLLTFQLNTWTEKMTRLRAGPLVSSIWNRMDSIAKEHHQYNGSFDAHKMVMYSAHDSTVTYLLDGLGLYDPPFLPPYASCVMVELFEPTTKNTSSSYKDSYEFRIMFRNETDHDPYVLSMCDGNEFCTIGDFESKTSSIRPADWQKECQTTDDTNGSTRNTNVDATALLLCVTTGLWKWLMATTSN